jgi:MFS family permease
LTLPVTLRSLRYRNFQLYRLTGSSVLLGLVSFSGQIPVFLMAPLGGIVAGRFRRQRTVIATQTASMLLALILAALTLTGTVQIWHVFVLSAPLGVVNAFDIPARQAFFVEMVGRDDLIDAIALNSSMFNASRIIGPAIAGILVASIGEGWCFFDNGVSYIAAIAGLLFMTVNAHKPLQAAGSPLADIIEGFRFVIGIPPIHQNDPIGNRECDRHAFRGAHADLRRPNPARGRGEGPGALGGDFGGRVRCVADCVGNFALVLALVRDSSAGGIRHDGGDGIVQYADTNHVAGLLARARDVGLFDDVYGYGATRRGIERRDGRALGRTSDGRRRWHRLHGCG